MKIISDENTKELFPYDFALTFRAEIIEKSVQISLLIKNTGDKKMPISP
jgi:galactose mutarotase-like enzyme